jgi:RNA polymerase sigma factor (sigma-70 family)
MSSRLGDETRLAELRSRLIVIAMRSYRLRHAEAEDVAQSALATDLEVNGRYGPEENHLGILHGIFRNKCLEYLDRNRRERQGLGRLVTQPDAARDRPWLVPEGQGAPGAMEELLRREEGRLILDALAHLRPETLALFRRLARLGRRALIAELGANKNTVDSRLHAGRRELKALLQARGISI